MCNLANILLWHWLRRSSTGVRLRHITSSPSGAPSGAGDMAQCTAGQAGRWRVQFLLFWTCRDKRGSAVIRYDRKKPPRKTTRAGIVTARSDKIIWAANEIFCYGSHLRVSNNRPVKETVPSKTTFIYFSVRTCVWNVASALHHIVSMCANSRTHELILIVIMWHRGDPANAEHIAFPSDLLSNQPGKT